MLKAVGIAASAVRMMNILKKTAVASAVVVCGLYAVRLYQSR